MTGTSATRLRAAFGAAAITAMVLASGVGPASAAVSGPAASVGHDTAKGKDDNGGGGGSKHDSRSGKGSKGDKGAKGKGSKGDKGGKGKGSTKQDGKAAKLVKAKAQADAAFARLLKRANGLSESSHAQVAANIAADRTLLAGLTTVDDVRALHPENYQQVISWLKQADKLGLTVEAPDAGIADAAAAVLQRLLAVTATSGRADLRGAKALLDQLEQLVDAALDGTGDDTTDPGDDTTDPGDDTDGPGTGTTDPGDDTDDPGTGTTDPGTGTGV